MFLHFLECLHFLMCVKVKYLFSIKNYILIYESKIEEFIKKIKIYIYTSHLSLTP
jgi:hypothetical protein